MISHQELEGHWNQIKGQIKRKWGQLTDNELTQGEGNVEKLVGIIQQKTGAARRDVEEFFNRFTADSENAANRAATVARDYAQQAGEAVAAGYQQASDAVSKGYQQATDAMGKGYEDVSNQVKEGYEQAENAIRSRPGEALTVAFGAGIITGIMVTLLMRPHRA